MTLVDTRPSVTDTAAALYVVASNAHRLAAEEVVEGSGTVKLQVMLDMLLPDTDPVQAGLLLMAIGTQLDLAEDLLRLTVDDVAQELANDPFHTTAWVLANPLATWQLYQHEASLHRGEAMTTAINAVRMDRQLP